MTVSADQRLIPTPKTSLALLSGSELSTSELTSSTCGKNKDKIFGIRTVECIHVFLPLDLWSVPVLENNTEDDIRRGSLHRQTIGLPIEGIYSLPLARSPQ
jgi:hypothetical protein